MSIILYLYYKSIGEPISLIGCMPPTETEYLSIAYVLLIQVNQTKCSEYFKKCIFSIAHIIETVTERKGVLDSAWFPLMSMTLCVWPLSHIHQWVIDTLLIQTGTRIPSRIQDFEINMKYTIVFCWKCIRKGLVKTMVSVKGVTCYRVINMSLMGVQL